jgi:hypothetical protein
MTTGRDRQAELAILAAKGSLPGSAGVSSAWAYGRMGAERNDEPEHDVADDRDE